MSDRVKVKRHPLVVRIVHWGIAISGIILGLSGLGLGGYYGIRIVSEQIFGLHLWSGLIFGALWIFFTYYMLAYEWKWISLGRIPYSIRFLLSETRAWFGGEHVEDPRGWSIRSKEYIEKIIPTQVMVWWIYLILTILMGFTGLSMYYRFDSVVSFAASFGPLFGINDGYFILRAAHTLGMYLFAIVLIMHVYAVAIFRVLTSMITGSREEKPIE
ncbi:MAG: cytochrome b/b6 domain-containing protein [Archaeoglobaceae archaeon]